LKPLLDIKLQVVSEISVIRKMPGQQFAALGMNTVSVTIVLIDAPVKRDTLQRDNRQFANLVSNPFFGGDLYLCFLKKML
jgi:hypothetical protein